MDGVDWCAMQTSDLQLQYQCKQLRTKEPKMANIIATHGDGFIKYDPEEVCTFELLYDKDGIYRGQNQDNVMDAGTLFIGAEMINGVPCVNGKPMKPLTSEEMAQAAEYQAAIDRQFGRR
jgi:hypothetical protein